MLTRILAVREVLTEASKHRAAATTGGERFQWNGLVLNYIRFIISSAGETWCDYSKVNLPVIQWQWTKRHFVTRPDIFLTFLALWIVLAVHSLHFVPQSRHTVTFVICGKFIHQEHQFVCENSRFWQISTYIHQAEPDRLCNKSDLFLNSPCLCQCNVIKKVFIFISCSF